MGGLAILLLSAMALAEPEADVLKIKVTATSHGSGVAGRTAALEQAQRDAVFEVIKGVTPAATEAAFRPLLDRASEYIRSFKILNQSLLGEYTRLEVEAYVLDPKLRKDLAAFLLPRFPRVPRMTVAIADGLAESGQLQFPAADAALVELAEAFTDAGIEVVDPARVQERCSQVEYRNRVRGEPTLAARFARENVADLAVVGEMVAVAEPAPAGSNLCSTRAILTIRLIRAADARLFDVLKTEAVVQSVDPKEALGLAISDACAKMREPMLVSSVLAVAGARGSDSVILTLDGVNDPRLWDGFCRALQAQPGVEEMEELHFGDGTGRLRLKYPGSVAPLVDLLTAGEVGDLRLEPKQVVEREMVMSVLN